jgi:AcrR family transcriptional regulator
VTETRGERKERTRRAILDAALRLCEDSSLVALSLRQVAKEVGIVPTAFYRHFDSIESLGLALVDESFVSLRAMLRDIRREDPATGSLRLAKIVDRSVETLVEHVHQQRSHFLFIARERAAGPLSVREAIRHEIELCERELATDLARLPGTASWSAEDLRVLSNLIVTAMVATAEQIMVAVGRPGAEKQIVETARTQLRMVLVGALNWQSRV